MGGEFLVLKKSPLIYYANSVSVCPGEGLQISEKSLMEMVRDFPLIDVGISTQIVVCFTCNECIRNGLSNNTKKQYVR